MVSNRVDRRIDILLIELLECGTVRSLLDGDVSLDGMTSDALPRVILREGTDPVSTRSKKLIQT